MEQMIQRQFSSAPPDKLLMFPGQYGVYSKLLSRELTIFTSGEKSNTILIIELPGYGLGVANIDTPAHAAVATKKIIEGLCRLKPERRSLAGEFWHKPSKMKATLIGASLGDFIFKGFPFGRNKHLICDSICKVLQENNIPFSHKRFSFDISSLFLPTIYLALYLTKLVDSEASYLKLGISLMVCFILQLYINARLFLSELPAENDYTSEDLYYVKVKVATNGLTIVSGERCPVSIFNLNFFSEQSESSFNRMLSNVYYPSLASASRSLYRLAGDDELINISVKPSS